MIDVLMPRLGESVAEGTVTKWLVKEGDAVRREQPLVAVSTDKADTDVPSPADGRVAQIVAHEGAVIPTNGLLARLDEAAAAVSPAAPAAPAGAPPAAWATGAEAARAPQQPGREEAPAAPAPRLASPSTRRMALQAGVDLGRMEQTGDRGRITHEDVRRAAAQPAAPPLEPAAPPLAQPPAGVVPAPELAGLLQAPGGWVPPIPGVGYGAYKVPSYAPKPGDEVVPFSRRRRITADHMVYSKHVSPHVVTVAEVDLYAVARLREANKERFKKEGVPLTYLAFVCAAVASSLREHPHLNARVLEGSFAVLKEVNLGIAVETAAGLVVPSIKHADQLSLRGIAASIEDLASRARSGKITADDLAGTTFTVSNPGQKGNLFGAAVISQPNVGILRMGELKKRVVVVSNGDEDTMAVHPVMYLALSYDHRVVDGVLANSFLWRIGDILTRGELWP